MTKRRDTYVSAVAWSVIVRSLLEGPCTALELCEETGLRHETILGYVRALRRQHAIHVARWVEDSHGRRTTAAYMLGNKPDAKRQPVPARVVKARYRQRAQQRQVFNTIQGIQP